MRGADTFTESLFTLRRLEDFVPEQHPLRPIRDMVRQDLYDTGLRPLEFPDQGRQSHRG